MDGRAADQVEIVWDEHDPTRTRAMWSSGPEGARIVLNVRRLSFWSKLDARELQQVESLIRGGIMLGMQLASSEELDDIPDPNDR